MIIENVAPTLTSSTDPELHLSAAVKLFDALNQAGIRYCHWKSNIRLEDSLAGRTDLDLLIDPQHEQAFRTLLVEQGFKPLVPPPDKKFPGVEHQLGFDWATGSLIHLHIHFNLVLGEHLLKNYCLPLEKQFLDSTILRFGVRISAPELELIVLCLRAMLKYRDRDIIKDVLSIRSPGIPVLFLTEIKWLSEQVSPRAFEKALSNVSNVIPGEPIQQFLRLVREKPRDGWKLLTLRTIVRRGLRRYRRRDQLAASFFYFKMLWRKFRLGERQMGLLAGGRKIALVGADGSGKTSLSQALVKWLSWKVDTHLLYLGSKQPSLLSAALYWLFRIARRSQTELSARGSLLQPLARLAGRIKNILLARHYLSIGVDRFRHYQLGSRLVGSGSVVIFDRFPFEAPLDGPEIGRIPAEHPEDLARFVRKEEELYHRMQRVDRLILLETPVEVSRSRKPDHPLAVIQAKNDAVTLLKERLSLSKNTWNWVFLDSSAPMQEVLLGAKRALWEVL